MIKKTILTIVALAAFAYSNVHAQSFTPIPPSVLGASGGSAVSGLFDISSSLGVSAGSVTLNIANGNANGAANAWVVSDSISTTYTFGGTTPVDAFVNHGANLGSPSFTNGTGVPRDGVTAASGESFTLTSAITSDYTAGSSGNDFFVDYTGTDTGNLESNSNGFVFTSDQPVSNFTVFTTNTADLDNGFGVGVRVSAVPEPTAGVILALGGLLALRRRRN